MILCKFFKLNVFIFIWDLLFCFVFNGCPPLFFSSTGVMFRTLVASSLKQVGGLQLRCLLLRTPDGIAVATLQSYSQSQRYCQDDSKQRKQKIPTTKGKDASQTQRKVIKASGPAVNLVCPQSQKECMIYCEICNNNNSSLFLFFSCFFAAQIPACSSNFFNFVFSYSSTVQTK